MRVAQGRPGRPRGRGTRGHLNRDRSRREAGNYYRQGSGGLEVIRHSTAHLLAQAVKQLFPEAQVTIGPVIEDGFFYDFAYKRPFTTEDLTAIEARMTQLAQADEKVTRTVMDRDAAVEYFKGLGEHYKAEIIASIPAGEAISLYGQGDWVDLCRGPHVPSTGKLTAFKLTKVAGAYWRGDSKNEMLQRIYGTAWADRKQLGRVPQALGGSRETRSSPHRPRAESVPHPGRRSGTGVLASQGLGDLAGRRAVHARHLSGVRLSGSARSAGARCVAVEEVRSLGQLPDNMFFTESEKRTYALKPMNCPGHVQIYNHGLHSYRDLPLRYGEFGACHRNEPSGGLHGILRVRGFTQDDGHIFCTEDQIESELTAFHSQALAVYEDFGFKDLQIKIALRPEKRIGSDAQWDMTEGMMRNALKAAGVEWEELPGEGAFYAPKIEYHFRDAIGRTWQLGTIQTDFMMPERLGAEYVGADSARHVPVMLHRAIVGSMERFIGILLEHHAGKLPPGCPPSRWWC